MTTPDQIEVRARGRKITGWTSASVSAGIEDAARSFSLALSGFWAATGQDQLYAGDPVEIYAGPDLVCTGYAEDVQDEIGAESEGVAIVGRSKACDAIDCSAALGTWSGLTLSALFAKIVGAHALELVDEAGIGAEVIRRHRTEPGETIHDALDRLVRELGALVTDDAQGRVAFTRAGKGGRASSPIVQGAGVLSSTGGWSTSERFSSYEVSGQSVQADDIEIAATGTAEDPAITRHRHLIVVPERPLTKTAARKRARWEAATRAGRSFSATYTLRGWRHGGDTGALWSPNQLVEVVDGRRGIFGAELLVTHVDLSLDNESGRRASVTVQGREAFDLLTTSAVPAGAGGAGRWIDLEASRELGRRTR